MGGIVAARNGAVEVEIEVQAASWIDCDRVHIVVNGDVVAGNLLSAEKNDVGILLTIAGEDEQLHLIPYHAIVSFGVAKAVLGGEE